MSEIECCGCPRCEQSGEVIFAFEEDNENLVIALREVLDYVRRVGGFMAPEDQGVMQRAREVLRE